MLEIELLDVLFNVGREGFEPTEAIKAANLQFACFDHLHIYPDRCVGGIRTHEACAEAYEASLMANFRHYAILEGNAGVKPA